MRKDRAMVDEANRLNQAEIQKHQDKVERMKKKLQDMNLERD